MNDIFWKATRPDGTDFYTGTVDYAAALESGEPLPELSGCGEFPGGTWYHLATVPTKCVGMAWPCRLFEVEPVGEVKVAPHKVGVRSLRVLREVAAHRVFGPQGEQVAALIERSKTLTSEEARRLDEYRAARDAVWDAARDAAWGAAWDAVWGAVWDAARDAVWGAARDAVRSAARVAARSAAWDAAWCAAWYAAVALVVRDLIGTDGPWTQAAYDLLTGPWRQVIGPIHPDDPTLRGDE